MTNSVEFTTNGFRELEHALATELPKVTARNAARRAMVDSLKPVEELAKHYAPKSEGDLAESITTKAVRAKRTSRTRYEASQGIIVATGPTGRPQGGNAAWQEFGTVDMPANAYMRPAADAEGENSLDRLGKFLAEQVNKAKARIARKLARQAKG